MLVSIETIFLENDDIQIKPAYLYEKFVVVNVDELFCVNGLYAAASVLL